MERLELLGDSVLKYAMSCHLFLKYPDKNEGGLSDKRRWAVCNSTLHKLGISRDIQVMNIFNIHILVSFKWAFMTIIYFLSIFIFVVLL